MKQAFIRSVITVLSIGALILAPTAIADAASTKVSLANLRGSLINASFTSFDPSGCIETDTFVTANTPSYQQLPSQPVTTTVGAVNIYEYDACTDTTLLQAIGESDALPAGALQVSKQLDWATLTATFTMTNIDTNATFDVDVHVALTGTSVIHRDDVNSNDFYGGGCHVLNRWKGSGRTAAASGSVSDGVTNYIPTRTAEAEIGYVIDGFEVIDCP
jgi:hypothetical protein